ncbi:cysteine desulfuration protein SufE [Candidatus Erwinia haradaeae]|uniref:Cysteine desulfuration protein SufE n=1 Tax=Candidatus Erwinia haradaeae TaxID=1922217 RepID=A0A451DAC9_9GAMM|nr:cysteine desulfuration protein SufE [Candidatus Erwinia haradaeae]VFP83290.1 Cysteine desulfuration protein SufE [Candidatus Erwinia haradaeae]
MSTLPDRDTLVFNFHRCANQEEKYLYIIELGSKLPSFSSALYAKKNIISGCQSQVWISVGVDKKGLVVLEGDSDAALVKGLIAIVFSCYKNMTPHNVLCFDSRPWFSGLAFSQQLTPSRVHGLWAMLRSIRHKTRLLLEE